MGDRVTNPNVVSELAGKSSFIKQPNFESIERTALTSTVATQFTSTGGWYAVRAINYDVSGANYAYILDSNNQYYLAAVSSQTGTYIRSVTPWVYFPVGKKFYARGGFTDATDSGLLYAPASWN